MTTNLEGRRILVVEDEALIGLMLEDLLQEIGCHVVATAARLEQAFGAVDDHAIEAAILDVNVNGQDSFGLAAVLAERNIPFMFTTGYGKSIIKIDFRNRPVIGKPYTKEDLRDALSILLPPSGRG